MATDLQTEGFERLRRQRSGTPLAYTATYALVTFAPVVVAVAAVLSVLPVLAAAVVVPICAGGATLLLCWDLARQRRRYRRRVRMAERARPVECLSADPGAMAATAGGGRLGGFVPVVRFRYRHGGETRTGWFVRPEGSSAASLTPDRARERAADAAATDTAYVDPETGRAFLEAAVTRRHHAREQLRAVVAAGVVVVGNLGLLWLVVRYGHLVG